MTNMTLNLPRTNTALGSKICSKCKELLPLTSFPAGKGKGGTFSYCRDCYNAYSRTYGNIKKFKVADDYIEYFVETEFRAFLYDTQYPKTIEYEFFCFNEDQVKGIVNRITEHTNKWKHEVVFVVVDKIFKIECKKVS